MPSGRVFSWKMPAPRWRRRPDGTPWRSVTTSRSPSGRAQAAKVRQLHARAYHPIGDEAVPIATAVSIVLASTVFDHRDAFPELIGWIPSEAGYQHYRGPSDFISPHRDRRNDRLLSVTFTLRGSAVVRILEPVDDPDDYGNLRTVDEFTTEPSTAMFLRAPGFCGGGQVIHEVLPPTTPDGRLILNLRMRPDVLLPP